MSKIPNLFELMKKDNITQQQLSEAIGFSQGNISDWKSGRSSPSVEALVKIAEYFNVSVDYLLGYTPKMEVADEKQKFLDLIKDASPLELEIIYNTAKTVLQVMREAKEN